MVSAAGPGVDGLVEGRAVYQIAQQLVIVTANRDEADQLARQLVALFSINDARDPCGGAS
jgi:hypothetical protein